MKLLMYLIRWQMSTPILAIVVYYLNNKFGSIITTIIANFIGGLIFYNVDKRIFK